MGEAEEMTAPARRYFLPFAAIAIAVLALALFWRRLVVITALFSHDGFYSQGALIPCLAALLAWTRRHELRRIPARPSASGVFLVLAVVVAVLLAGPFLNTLTPALLAGFAAGIVLAFSGPGALRALRTPLLLLLLMIPIPPALRAWIDFPLQLFCVRATALVCRLAGIAVANNGAALTVGAVTLNIAPECNGLRSTAALFAASIVYSDLLRLSVPWRFALAVMAVPVAYAANLLRLFSDALFLHWAAGRPAAEYEGLVDRGWGLVVFAGVVLTCSLLIQRLPRDRARHLPSQS